MFNIQAKKKTYKVAPAAAGLVSYWRLNETSGARADIFGVSNLSDNGGVTSASGIIGNAASFAKASSQSLSCVSNTSLTNLTSFTVAGWMYFDSIGGSGVNNAFFSKWSSGGGGTNEFFLAYQPGSPGFAWFVTGTGGLASVVNNPGISTSIWYFVVADYDATTGLIGLSFNGGEKSTAALSGTVQTASNDFYLGTIPGFGNYYMDGRLDEVGFWRRSLSLQEIKYLYNSGRGRTYPFTLSGP